MDRFGGAQARPRHTGAVRSDPQGQAGRRPRLLSDLHPCHRAARQSGIERRSFERGAARFTGRRRAPADTRITPDGGGIYTVNGKGFLKDKTELILGTRALKSVTGAPNAGEFQLSPPSKILFQAPADLTPAAPGTYRYSVRVRVNGVEASSVLWIEVTRP